MGPRVYEVGSLVVYAAEFKGKWIVRFGSRYYPDYAMPSKGNGPLGHAGRCLSPDDAERLGKYLIQEAERARGEKLFEDP